MAVAAASVTMMLLVVYIPSHLSQFLGLGFQQFVKFFLYTTSFPFELPLDYFLF